MDFDLRSLGHAQALAEHASFARAANALHITQPALSRSIQQLERRVGVRLFDRGPGRVEPTETGRLFLVYARELLARASDLRREMTLVRGVGTGRLAVGAGTYPAEGMVDAAVAALVQRYPALSMRILVDNWANLIEFLRKREVDLVIAEATLARADPELEVTSLARYQGYFVVRTGHPLTRLRSVTLAEILDFPVVSTARLPARLLDPLLKEARADSQSGAREFPSVTCESLAMMKRVAALSDAVAILPLKMAAREIESGELTALPLVEPWLNASFAVIRLARRSLSPEGDAFIRILAEDHTHFARDERIRMRNLLARTGRRRRAATH
jgi:DNA-binding transcriptional LysR family regulator